MPPIFSGEPFEESDDAHGRRLTMGRDIGAASDFVAVLRVILVRLEQHLFVGEGWLDFP